MAGTVKATEEQKKYIDTLAVNLKTLRAAAGVSQQELSSAVGICRETYVNYENQKKPIPWNVYLAIMYYFQHFEKANLILTALNLKHDLWSTTKP